MFTLGPFGFLYFGDDSPIQGNMGLMDQQHENIGAFGGDRSRVTLFGESAGSASATAHLFAPNSLKYFRNIIAKSGSIINSWASATQPTMLDLSLRLAKKVNCSSPDMTVVAKCLRSVPAHLVQAEADNISGDIGPPMTFAYVPVSSDVNFFQGNVFQKLENKQFKKGVNIIFGSIECSERTSRLVRQGKVWKPECESEEEVPFKVCGPKHWRANRHGSDDSVGEGSEDHFDGQENRRVYYTHSLGWQRAKFWSRPPSCSHLNQWVLRVEVSTTGCS